MAFRLRRTLAFYDRTLVRHRSCDHRLFGRTIDPFVVDRNRSPTVQFECLKQPIAEGSDPNSISVDQRTIDEGRRLEAAGHQCIRVTNIFPLTISYCCQNPCVGHRSRN